MHFDVVVFVLCVFSKYCKHIKYGIHTIIHAHLDLKTTPAPPFVLI